MELPRALRLKEGRAAAAPPELVADPPIDRSMAWTRSTTSLPMAAAGGISGATFRRARATGVNAYSIYAGRSEEEFVSPSPSSSIATPASSAARIKACRTVSAGMRPASQARQKSIALC